MNEINYQSPGQRRCRSGTAMMLAGLLLLFSAAAPAQTAPDELLDKSIEELMDIEIMVTSAARKEQRLSQTPAAIYVLTREDIRRSGLTTVPELLRLVPGMYVARIDASKWIVTARGFGGRYSNKLLVLVDGRSVYNPFYTSVFWDEQDLVVEDIERIEVIRGPGATLWGANAVNGVINIVTRAARDTQGGLATAVAGTGDERGSGMIRFGGQAGDHLAYRIYGKYFNRNAMVNAAGRETPDAWDAMRGGFRLDWEASHKDLLTLQGDIYEGNSGQNVLSFSLLPPYQRALPDTARIGGGNVIGRWTRTLSDKSDMALQLYYDRSGREEVVIGTKMDTFDLDFQHHFAAGKRHDVVWGLGYRLVSDRVRKGLIADFNPSRRTTDLFSVFAQDEITLKPSRAWLTIGTKLERNDFSGFEFQPNIRFSLIPRNRQTIWASVARAVRIPARRDSDLQADALAIPGPQGITILAQILGNPQLKPEALVAYEAGYRVQPATGLSLDVATFYNDYRNLQTNERGLPFFRITPLPHLVMPFTFGNGVEGRSYGGELSAGWLVNNRLKLNGGYSLLRISLKAKPWTTAGDAEVDEDQSPRHQFHLRSHLSLPRGFEFDTSMNYVGRVRGTPGQDLSSRRVPAWLRLDARLGWTPKDNLELSFGAQNLLDNRHPESSTVPRDIVIVSEIRRSIIGKITWRFQ